MRDTFKMMLRRVDAKRCCAAGASFTIRCRRYDAAATMPLRADYRLRHLRAPPLRFFILFAMPLRLPLWRWRHYAAALLLIDADAMRRCHDDFHMPPLTDDTIISLPLPLYATLLLPCRFSLPIRCLCCR